MIRINIDIVIILHTVNNDKGLYPYFPPLDEGECGTGTSQSWSCPRMALVCTCAYWVFLDFHKEKIISCDNRCQWGSKSSQTSCLRKT